MKSDCESCIYRVRYHVYTGLPIECELSHEKKAQEGNCNLYSKTVIKNLFEPYFNPNFKIKE